MRVLYAITRADAIGGAQIHVLHLSAELQRMGHEVLVVTGEGEVFPHELSLAGVPYRRLPGLKRNIDPRPDVRALAALGKVIEDFRPDILSTHSSKMGVLGRIAGRRRGVPTVFTAHGWSFAEGVPLLPRFFYRQVERGAAPMAARIVTVCEADRGLALRYRLAPPERIVTIHNGVPDVEPELVSKPRGAVCQIVCVARLEPQKDLDIVLHALAALSQLPWRLSIIGDGPLRKGLEQTAAALGIRDRIDFAGYRRDVAEVLAQQDAFILPSRWEGFPRTILEAMRAGLPVIASDVGGIREAVVEDETGFTVRRSGEWKPVLEPVIQDRDLRIRMGAAARNRYLSHFTLERMVGETTALYTVLLNEDGARRTQQLPPRSL